MITSISLNRDADRKGFTLVEIMIVAGILGLLAAIAVPHFIRQREYARKNVCIENLRQIAAAKAVWAQEKNKNNSIRRTSPTCLAPQITSKRNLAAHRGALTI